MTDEAGRERRARLREVFGLFLRLGFTSFGGPAAHVALMEDEVVRRRKWLSREAFLDLVGATNLVPGPNSTELAIHLGRERAGWAGLVVAGLSFIGPAMLLTLAFAWAYVTYGARPEAAGVLWGVKPVIVAVVLQALWGLGRSAVKDVLTGVVGVAAVAGVVAGAHELVVLLLAGAVTGGARAVRGRVDGGPTLGFAPWAFAIPGAVAVSAPSVSSVFLFFLKVGSVLYGSGYVLLAFLRADLVERWGWLTEAQLLDAVAVGQFTPGPVFTTATFVGYVLQGVPGALAATVGIFLPAFVFVALSGPLVPRIRASKVAGAVLDGVNVASLALMVVVSAQLGRAAIVDVRTLAIAVVAGVALVRFRVNSAWLVLVGAVVGVVVHLSPAVAGPSPSSRCALSGGGTSKGLAFGEKEPPLPASS